MKATKQYLPAVLFIMLFKVVLMFESVGEILNRELDLEKRWEHFFQTLYFFIDSTPSEFNTMLFFSLLRTIC